MNQENNETNNVSQFQNEPNSFGVNNNNLQAPQTTTIPEPQVIIPQPETTQNVNSFQEGNIKNSEPQVNMQMPISNGDDQLPQEKKKKKILPILLIALLLIVICVGGFFVYKQMQKNPIRESVTSIIKSVKSNNNLLTDDYKVTTNISFDTSNQQLSFIKNNSINVETSHSKDNLFINFKLNENNNSLLDIKSYLTGSTIYVKEPNITDKTYFIKLDDESSNSSNSISNEDMEFIINKVQEATEKAFKDIKLNKEDAQVKVNNKTIKVKYNYYLITSANIKNISDNFISVFEEASTLKKLSEITKMSENDIKEYLKMFKIKENDESIKKDMKVKIGVYTSGILNNNVIGVAIYSEDKEVLTYVEDGNIGSGKYIVDDKNSIIINKNNNKITMDIMSDGKQIASVAIEEKNENDANIQIIIPNYVTININIKTEKLTSNLTFDTNNAVDYKTITQEDLVQIENKLQTTLMESELFKEIQNLLPNEPDELNSDIYLAN